VCVHVYLKFWQEVLHN